MNKPEKPHKHAEPSTPLWLIPLKMLAWPFVKFWQYFHRNFVSYLLGGVLRDENRIYSIKFIWYDDSVYWHPMIWGSLIMYLMTKSGVESGWLLLIWFVMLSVCYMCIAHNFNVVRTAMLGVGIVAFLGIAFFSTVEWSWNPLTAISRYIISLNASVTAGFYAVSAYVFTGLIACEVLWAWFFHRVEIDESYVYEHRFLMGTAREPIFARGLKRETKDLLELLILGAGDIEHRTKTGVKRFKNVPAASLWLGRAIDSMLDYRRQAQIRLETRSKDKDDEDEQGRLEDAMPDIIDEMDADHDEGDHEGDHDDDGGLTD